MAHIYNQQTRKSIPKMKTLKVQNLLEPFQEHEEGSSHY